MKAKIVKWSSVKEGDWVVVEVTHTELRKTKNHPVVVELDYTVAVYDPEETVEVVVDEASKREGR